MLSKRVPALHYRDPHGSEGFTLVELLVALALSAIILSSLGAVVSTGLQTKRQAEERSQLTGAAQFAMQRMLQGLGNTRRLLLPAADNSATSWPENIREETVPASPPPAGSSKATAVLAVTLPLNSDLDGDAFADADNDRDGRVDEDWPSDIHYDFTSGIIGIDDDGDGNVDQAHTYNDDESLSINDEDAVNGLDDDGDGSIDEDPPADMNDDGCPGICGVDDDGDGSIDEGAIGDDDEDGADSEDWLDPVVFYLEGGVLKERTPVPWDENTDGSVNGKDFITSDIATNVTRLRVERLDPGDDRDVRVELLLELTSPTSGEKSSLIARVRVGGAS